MSKSKVAYVCSRYRADTGEVFKSQLQVTEEISRTLVLGGYDIIAPHSYYPLFLDDDDETEREVGMKSALRLLSVCDVMFVHIGNRVSVGMEAEIQEAKSKNMDIRYFTNMNDLRDILKRLRS